MATLTIAWALPVPQEFLYALWPTRQPAPLTSGREKLDDHRCDPHASCFHIYAVAQAEAYSERTLVLSRNTRLAHGGAAATCELPQAATAQPPVTFAFAQSVAQHATYIGAHRTKNHRCKFSAWSWRRGCQLGRAPGCGIGPPSAAPSQPRRHSPDAGRQPPRRRAGRRQRRC